VIEAILPPEVAAEEAFEDVTDVVLFPEEEAVLTRAVGKRRREFTTARACARAALARLGLPPSPIVPGLRGAPQWPAGVTGSITHCAGYRAAAVARTQDVISLGLDAEPIGPLPAGVLDVISLEQERAQLAELAASHPGVNWDRLLFCAKESVYKAWFPITRRWLDFKEASVAFDAVPNPAAPNPAPNPAGAGTFTASILVPGPVIDDRLITSFTGRWLSSRNLLVTAITVTAPRTVREKERAQPAEPPATS
jgi:4'-phosphopantetheinyl transferase EntD